MENTMLRVLMGVALAAVMAAAPAVAKSKSESGMKSESSQKSFNNREPGPDGTLQGKPVVAGPADWTKGTSANAGSSDSSSTGASSGEAGSAK
jgi:hypothetical protein